MSVTQKDAVGPRPAPAGSPIPSEEGGRLTRVFKALSSETRVNILRLLERRDYSVSELTSNFHVAQPSISRHLAILADAHLVTRRRQGQRVYYGLEPDELNSSIQEFLGHFRHLREPRLASPLPRNARRMASGLSG